MPDFHLHVFCVPPPSTDSLYSPWLSGECSGTLGANHGERQLAVALPLASRETAAEQICFDLGCGGVMDVSEGAAPRGGSSLLANCTYSEGGLRNCTLGTAWGNSSGATEIICGEMEFYATQM